MTTRQPVVAFVVNGGPDSAMAERATSFAARLADRYDCRMIHRDGGKLGAARRIARALAAVRPDLCYVLDLAFSGVAAAGLYKHATGTPFIVDTGDAVVELGRALGRGPAALAATQALESYALRAASAVVVRGPLHQQFLARRGVRAEYVPDGVDVEQFAPSITSSPTDGSLVIGVLGSIVWVPGRGMCYGWELIELVRLLRGRLPVRGVLIGDGSGSAVLKRRCAECGIEDRVEFAGHVPHGELPGRLQQWHIGLSTQTDDVIGNVRTTGKLPLYLAAGRFVLASRVGTAAQILPEQMLVSYRGSNDPEYPARLAERILDLTTRGETFAPRRDAVRLAREHFDYDILAPRVARVIDRLLVADPRRASVHRLRCERPIRSASNK